MRIWFKLHAKVSVVLVVFCVTSLFASSRIFKFGVRETSTPFQNQDFGINRQAVCLSVCLSVVTVEGKTIKILLARLSTSRTRSCILFWLGTPTVTWINS